jgi:hypothetical protein
MMVLLSSMVAPLSSLSVLEEAHPPPPLLPLNLALKNNPFPAGKLPILIWGLFVANDIDEVC